MKFEIIESVFTITADMTMTTAMAAVLLVLGYFIKRKVYFPKLLDYLSNI